MSRHLLEKETVGMPTWAWSLVWLAGGIVLGAIGTLTLQLCLRRCAARRTFQRHISPPVPNKMSPYYTMRSPRETLKFDSLSASLPGSSANHVDGSVSASHWNNTSLTTVVEHPADAEKRQVAKSIRTLGPSQTNTSSVASTVQYSTASTNPSLMGGDKSTRHDRTVSAASAMSSVGPSAEYDEDDLDDDWKYLIQEVNSLLISKGKVPIQNAKERATVVNSLLVSTSTRSRQDCIRNAAVDMLTFRKLSGAASTANK